MQGHGAMLGDADTDSIDLHRMLHAQVCSLCGGYSEDGKGHDGMCGITCTHITQDLTVSAPTRYHYCTALPRQPPFATAGGSMVRGTVRSACTCMYSATAQFIAPTLSWAAGQTRCPH